jgi:glutamate-1-semialdehyde 2,1-aminomutase
MKGNIDARNLLNLEMIHRGYYIARRGFVALSLPITETDTNGLVAAFGEFLDEHGAAIVAETAGA